MEYPSVYLENVVNEFSKLPGVGERTALRFALHLLSQDKKVTERLVNSLVAMNEDIKLCKRCFSISDAEEWDNGLIFPY